MTPLTHLVDVVFERPSKREKEQDFLQMKVHFRANLEDLRISHKRVFLPKVFCTLPFFVCTTLHSRNFECTLSKLAFFL